MASLGFDVVRLGIIWKGLEPGHDPINDPSICTPGKPSVLRQTSSTPRCSTPTSIGWRPRWPSSATTGSTPCSTCTRTSTTRCSPGRGRRTGPSAPTAITPKPQRNVQNWSVNYTGPGVSQAYGHFWDNDVVGDLQGAFDTVWTRVAARFRNNPWVVGYDPFNEPYGPGLGTQPDNPAFDAELECFYTGRAHPGLEPGWPASAVPGRRSRRGSDPSDRGGGPQPPRRLRGQLQHRLGGAQPHRCHGLSTAGPELPRLLLPARPQRARTAELRNGLRPTREIASSPSTPRSAPTTRSSAQPEWTRLAAHGIRGHAPIPPTSPASPPTPTRTWSGWIYWQWINYDDPTGSHSSALWPARPQTAAQLHVLAETYASAIAGTPTSMTFDPTTGAFALRYRSDPRITEPTVIVVPDSTHYPHGYCLGSRGRTRRPDPVRRGSISGTARRRLTSASR